MSRKHYQAIAEALGGFQAEMTNREQENFSTLIGDLCQIFTADNSDFVSWRFIQAIEAEAEKLAD